VKITEGLFTVLLTHPSTESKEELKRPDESERGE